jgi:hypothetical protein
MGQGDALHAFTISADVIWRSSLQRASLQWHPAVYPKELLCISQLDLIEVHKI